MDYKQLNIICFSPTGGTKKILKTIADQMSFETTKIFDLTLSANKITENSDYSDLTVIGVPVYSGRVPSVAVDRIRKLRSSGAPAVIVAVYGNRDYDDALVELYDLAIEIGFKPVAAAAFIAEHSFSSEAFPIAALRPDKDDLQKITTFGKQIDIKLRSGDLNLLSDDKIPGNRPYMERKPSPSFSPETEKSRCINCMKCVKICPTEAISKTDTSITNVDRCILCGACVKVCENNARVIKDPTYIKIAKRLNTYFSTRKEPETFL